MNQTLYTVLQLLLRHFSDWHSSLSWCLSSVGELRLELSDSGGILASKSFQLPDPIDGGVPFPRRFVAVSHL